MVIGYTPRKPVYTTRMWWGLSLLTFLRIYIAGLQSGKLLGGMYLEAVICITLMAVIAVSSLLILLFGVLKKPIAAIVFSVLAVVAFYALRWDFDDRGRTAFLAVWIRNR